MPLAVFVSDGQAPESFQVAFERVQLPSWKPANLVEVVGGFDGEQKLAQLVSHRGRYPLWRCRLHGAAEALYGESGQTAFHPFMIPVCTVIPYPSSLFQRRVGRIPGINVILLESS
jgi:hypothetical protein